MCGTRIGVRRHSRLPPAPLGIRAVEAEVAGGVGAGGDAEPAVGVGIGPHVVGDGGRIAGMMVRAGSFRSAEQQVAGGAGLRGGRHSKLESGSGEDQAGDKAKGAAHGVFPAASVGEDHCFLSIVRRRRLAAGLVGLKRQEILPVWQTLRPGERRQVASGPPRVLSPCNACRFAYNSPIVKLFTSP